MAEPIESIPSSGVLSAPIRGLARLVSESATFQRRAGECYGKTIASPDQAYEYVYHFGKAFAEDYEPTGPFAVVFPSTFGLSQGMGPFLRLRSISLTLMLHDVVDEHEPFTEWSQIAFTNFLGDVVDDLAGLQGSDDRIVLQSLVLPEGGLIPPSLRTAGEAKPYWTAALDCVVAAVRR